MTKIEALYNVLNNYADMDMETRLILEDMVAQFEQKEEKAKSKRVEKAATYDAAWPVVAEAMKTIGTAATVADIFNECEPNLADGFTKNRLSYGMTHYWADRVVKTAGKVNTYTLKE